MLVEYWVAMLVYPKERSVYQLAVASIFSCMLSP